MGLKKSTQYTKYRNKLLNKITSLKRKGIITDLVIPTSEKQLKNKGVKGKDLAKETRKIKSILNNFDKIDFVDTKTGEKNSYSEIKKERRKDSAKRAYETRKNNKQSEREFWSQEYYPKATDKALDILYDNFISKLQSVDEKSLTELEELLYKDINRYTSFGRKRRWDNYKASLDGKNTLIKILKQAIEKDGKDEVGKRLIERQEEVEPLVMYTLYGSDCDKINNAVTELATIIAGSSLMPSTLKDLSDEEEYNDYGFNMNYEN